MKKKIFFIYILIMVLALGNEAKSQALDGLKSASISFVTSQNVYVRMEDASHIAIGDTLYIQTGDNLLAALVITAKSSISCVTQAIPGAKIAKGQTVLYYERAEDKPKVIKAIKSPTDTLMSIKKEKKKAVTLREKERISGRISAASYSSIAGNNNMTSHRFAERFQLDIDHIQNSNLSLESYFTATQIYQQREQPTGISPNRFRVYNLGLNYTFPNQLSASVGRKINRNMSSIGAVDGIQVEKSLGQFSFGALAGFKPDLYDYSFNATLGQFGAYMAYSNNLNKNFRTSSTLGLIHQGNSGNTDRRYTYLQHQSTLFKNLNFFVSSELDLYDGKIDSLKSGMRLTNLFTSLRYQVNKSLSLMVSYDQRRRVIYYESYQLDIENILNNDLSTTGWRTRINYKITKNLYTGLTYNSRNRNNTTFTSMGGYMTISKLPFIPGGVSLYYNENAGNSISTRSMSASYRTSFLKKKLSTYTYYRYVGYTSSALEGSLATQHYYGSKVNFRVTDKLSFGLLGEYSYNQNDKNYRINAQIIKRFN